MPRNRDEYFTISVVSIALFIFFHNFFFFDLLLVVAALPFISFLKPCWTRISVLVSMEDVASSRMSMGGDMSMSLAMQMSCIWP